MKKLIAFLSAGLMLVAIAAPAMAKRGGGQDGCGPCGNDHHGHKDDCCPEIEIENDNWADVVTTADSNSNTGGNAQMGGGMFSGGNNNIITGAAYSGSWAGSWVNSNVNTVRVGRLMGPIEVENDNGAWVRTGASADSNTGRNHQMGCGFGCGVDTIRTGPATSFSDAESHVNANETVVRSWGTWSFGW